MPYKNAQDRRRKHRELYEAGKIKLRRMLQNTPCKDCGRTGDWRVMEFDHRPGTGKKRTVATLLKGKWETVLREIEKCDIVCACCHKIRSHERGQFKRKVKPKDSG